MDNHYQDKFNEFIHHINNLMFTFEVTKCCGYSTFITIYKNQSLMDLYSNIVHHFGNIQINKLYFISSKGERINIPMSKRVISEFIRENVTCNPIKLHPIYELPKPVIYRLFMDDDHCSGEHCTTVHYI